MKVHVAVVVSLVSAFGAVACVSAPSEQTAEVEPLAGSVAPAGTSTRDLDVPCQVGQQSIDPGGLNVAARGSSSSGGTVTTGGGSTGGSGAARATSSGTVALPGFPLGPGVTPLSCGACICSREYGDGCTCHGGGYGLESSISCPYSAPNAYYVNGRWRCYP